MGPVKGFRVSQTFYYDVGTHHHPATGFQFLPPGEVGNLHRLSMDPPMGWLTGSGSYGLGQDWAADGLVRTLGLAPLVGVELHWGPSLRVGCGESVDPVVAGIRVSDHLMVSPLARKRVVPWGNVGSLFSSLSMLNLICFFGFSSTRVGALLCHTLLLDSQVLECNFRSLMWRQSHSPAGLDLRGLGEGNWDCPWHHSEGLWHCLDLLLLLNWECHFCDLDHPIWESSLGCLATSIPHGSAEGETSLQSALAMGASPTS